MTAYAVTVVADKKGMVTARPELIAVGRSAHANYPLAPAQLMPLPPSSRLYLLPGRQALGLDTHGILTPTDRDHVAVAAFLPPGYVALALAAFTTEQNAPRLPLFCYCAVCWYRGKLHVPALRVDRDPKHDIANFDMQKVYARIRRWTRKFPHNRLMAHHGLVCVKKYGCPNAANLFLRRWEAPVAVSNGCNAACQGCISKQHTDSIPAPQTRIGFVPTVAEIVEIAVPHLQQAPRAMISFGQGCEGEPLLQGDLLESAIRAIRRETNRGTIHLNTNGSLPKIVGRLAAAGLDSIRISLNSARPKLYGAYYRCRGYSLADVRQSFLVARKAGLWVAINYLTFPGVTDDPAEYKAFGKLLERTNPHMIQWRNLNIDPDWYMQTVDRACPGKHRRPMGLTILLEQIHRRFPQISFGYFNLPLPAHARQPDRPSKRKEIKIALRLATPASS